MRHIRAWVLSESACGIVLAAGLLAQPAFAQSEPAASQTADGAVAEKVDEPANEIIVTGSLIARSTFNSPTPVTAIDDKLMKNLAVNNVADVLNQIPAFRPAITPASNFFQVKSAIAARTMDLRGLGQQRTLVLLDGQRFVGSNDLGTLDLNQIPSSLIGRSEVVTGGASAAYGADAVAGVVNLILDTSLEGMKADVNYGVSQRGDNKSYFGSFAAGTKFAGGRGHALIGLEYANEKGLGDCQTRSWCSKYTNYIPNPGWPNNGLPATLVRDDVQFVLNTGGLIPSGPLRGTQFDRNGSPIPFTFGEFYGGTFMVGGDPSVPKGQLFSGQPLMAPNSHFSALGRISYELTDRIDASLTFNYSHAEGGPVGTTYIYDFAKSIPIDNAYISPALRTLMVNAGVTSIPVNHFIEESPLQNVARTKNDTYRIAASLKGELWGDWRWDINGQYGLTKGRLDSQNIRITSRYNQAIDAVLSPTGQIVCRSTLTNPGNGCIPINYFGAGNVSAAALDWAQADAWQTRKYQLMSIDGKASGTVFDGWAGPISAAAGLSYRQLRSSGDADANSKAGVLMLTVASALPLTKAEVKEVFGEVNVPLLRDLPFVESLEVDGAVRLTDYNNFGSATTWKVGVVYRVSSDLMFRYTRSHDIREPNAQELNPLGTSIALPLNDPKLNQNYLIQTVTSGNPNLRLEAAETETIGVVLTPTFAPRLRLSVDYYNIRMDNAIDTLSAQSTLNLCNSGVTQLCGFITRDGAGLVTQVTSTYQNLAGLHASGAEAVLNYGVDLAGAKLPGRVDFTLNGSWIDELTQTTPTGATIQLKNWTGNPGSVTSILGVPKYKLNGYLTYSTESLSVTFSGRYTPSALLDPTKIGPEQAGYDPKLPNSISTNRIASRFYLDLSANYRFTIGGGLDAELYGAISNVLDKSPPSTLRIYGNPLYFDPIGRSFKMGLRVKM